MSTNSLFRLGKFSPKKASPRKAITNSPLQMDAAARAREFGLDFNNAHMELGDKTIRFDPDTGDWFHETGIAQFELKQFFRQENLIVFLSKSRIMGVKWLMQVVRRWPSSRRATCSCRRKTTCCG